MKDIKKQKSKIKNLFFVGKEFHKNLCQRSYQWGTQGGEKNSKLKRSYFREKSIPQKISQRSYQWVRRERYLEIGVKSKKLSI